MILRKDLEAFTGAARLMIIDGSEISPSAYDELAKKLCQELDEKAHLHYVSHVYT